MSKFSNMKLRYKVGVGVATTAAIAGMAGGAFAYWTQTSTGSGTATTGSQTAYSVAGSNAINLTPGASQDLTAVVTNAGPLSAPVPGHVHVDITSVSGQSTIAGLPLCTVADYALSNSGDMTTTATGPLAHAATASYSGVAVSMVNRQDTVAGDGSGNQDNCQGATVHLTFSAAS